MNTFEDVVRGERAVARIYADEHHIAFLNPSPVRPGHTIVLPRRVEPYLFDMDADEYDALWRVVRSVAQHLRTRIPCERVCVAVVGWQVRHVHVHLVPTDADGQFPPLPGSPADPSEIERLARVIGQIAALG